MAELRADARANRDALLRSAAERFALDGPDVPLDAVALEAGVSIATLYRHFPNREALVAALYADELHALADVAPLLADGSGIDAMRAWANRFVGYAGTKRALGDLLYALPEKQRPSAREPILTAIREILAAGQADATITGAVDAVDVLAMFGGLWTLPADPDWHSRADRLAEFVLAALGR